MRNLVDLLRLPEGFGLTLLVVGVILTLAPYLPGDYGILTIPAFPDAVRRRLRVVGPLWLLAATLVHVPAFPPAPVIPSGVAHDPPGASRETRVEQADPPAPRVPEIPSADAAKNPPARVALASPPPDDRLAARLRALLRELEEIERHWDTRHMDVTALADRAASLLEERYPDGAARLRKTAGTADRAEEVARAIRQELRRTLDLLAVKADQR